MHHSHNLYAYKGVTFCAKCGGYGIHRTSLLPKVCETVCGDGPRGYLVKRLFAKEMPVSLKGWPALVRNGVDAELTQNDRNIICNIPNQLNELCSKPRESSEEEVIEKVVERPSANPVDLPDDPFLACEE